MPQARASGLFVSLCSIQAPDGTLTASGAPSGNYVAVAGLQGIPCTAPPPSEARIQATQLKDLEDIISVQLKHVLLDGYYPTLEAGIRVGWQAIIGDNVGGVMVNGVVFDILGAESDSQGTQSRMEVKLATV
jgi:hypothetical protein